MSTGVVQFAQIAPSDRRERIALCLAGVGVRAVLFHLGTLRRLNEFGILPCIDTVSSVSGGSIVAGVLAKGWSELRADRDGVFVNFESVIAEPISRLAVRGLRRQIAWWKWASPKRWLKRRRGDFNRCDELALRLDRELFRGAMLADIPAKPRFVFSATNLRTAARWEFSPERVGDVVAGFTSEHELTLAEAVAASAADPLNYPPMLLRFDPQSFENGAKGSEAAACRGRAHLSDGGIHDSLALEAVWPDHHVILCSDADHALEISAAYQDWFGSRIWRSYVIALEQKIEMNQRWLLAALANQTRQGAYIGLAGYHGQYGVQGSVGYSKDIVQQIKTMKTSLEAFDAKGMMALVNHGYTLTDAALHRYLADQLAANAPLRLPYPQFVDRTRVLDAIEQDRPVNEKPALRVA